MAFLNFKYWKILIIVIVWVSGWGSFCYGAISAIKSYDVEIQIQQFLSGMIIHHFLPVLLLTAVTMASFLLYSHPKWYEKSVKVRIRVPHRPYSTSIVK